MFLEICGKLFFSKIRPVFFYFLLALPFFIVGSYLWNHHALQQDFESRFANAAKKGKVALERKTRKERFIQRHANADPFFLDKQIESQTFLQKELSSIQSMIQHPALSDTRILQERFRFLVSDLNQLSFTEENIRTASRMKETDEKQRHPVQMDESDLQKLLAHIEDIPVGQNQPLAQLPQILIREIKIKKTENPLHSEVYEVEMELLKREWTNP